ncbi:MAG: DUF58 domain-containing protein [Candidatus Dojkabacteria bacterium]|nr:MAG: DUF58 domain-containing protein [Candidatus Dojkabacteria bacterium]
MAEYLKSLKRLKISPRKQIVSLLMGAYSSLYRGHGVELQDLREYVAGDNVRDIDWNATARTQKVYIRQFREQKEITLLFVIDTSSSVGISSRNNDQKINVITDFVTLMTYAAMQHNDSFGAVFYNSAVQEVVPFAKGKQHARQIVNTVAKAFEHNYFQQTSHELLKKILLQGVKKKTYCFLITDALDITKESIDTFKTLNKKHDVTIVHLVAPDPVSDAEFMPFVFQDIETGEMLLPEEKEKSSTDIVKQAIELFEKSHVPYMPISVTKDLLQQVIAYYSKFAHTKKR